MLEFTLANNEKIFRMKMILAIVLSYNSSRGTRRKGSRGTHLWVPFTLDKKYSKIIKEK